MKLCGRAIQASVQCPPVHVHAGNVPRFCSTCRSSSSGPASTSSSNDTAGISDWSYNDGTVTRTKKATLERAFGGLQAAEDLAAREQEEAEASQQQEEEQQGSTQQQQNSSASKRQQLSRQPAPWEVGFQVSERNALWGNDLKLRLVQRVASEELGITEVELQLRLQQLAVLLPDLQARLAAAPPKLVARLCASPAAVAERLLKLKEAFPQANVSRLVSNSLGILLEGDVITIAAAAVRLRALLPGLDVDRLVEAHPIILDVPSLEMALDDAARILPPGTNAITMLGRNPDSILSLLKGKGLVPYDEFSNPWSKVGDAGA